MPMVVHWRPFSLFMDSLFSIRSTLYSKKYGVTLARFTHHKNNVIYASTKEDGKTIFHGIFHSRSSFFFLYQTR